MSCEIVTSRFILRELTEKDVNQNYLNWFDDAETKRYISYSSNQKNIRHLKEYVSGKHQKEDTLFLGIFTKKTKVHIGNIKYEPINYMLGTAVVGILIGEKEYRGMGVAKEAIFASASWLKESYRISKIILGVEITNIQAIRAYEKVGFVIEGSEKNKDSNAGTQTMVYLIDSVFREQPYVSN